MSVEYFPPPLKIVTTMADAGIANAFAWSFCSPVVESVETNGETKIIHMGSSLVPHNYWLELYEALEEHGSVWMSSVDYGEDEYNEDLIYGAPLFLLEPTEGYWEVRHAYQTNKKLVWNRVRQFYEWVNKPDNNNPELDYDGDNYPGEDEDE